MISRAKGGGLFLCGKRGAGAVQSKVILDVTWEEESVPPNERNKLEGLLRQAMEEGLCRSGRGDEAEVGVILVDEERIQALNLAYRGVDNPTDVLSFALQEELEEEPEMDLADDMLGDIVISVPRAKAQAAEYGHSLERELIYLAVHGLFHLLGYDHEQEAEKQEMRCQEEEVMSKLDLMRV